MNQKTEMRYKFTPIKDSREQKNQYRSGLLLISPSEKSQNRKKVKDASFLPTQTALIYSHRSKSRIGQINNQNSRPDPVVVFAKYLKHKKQSCDSPAQNYRSRTPVKRSQSANSISNISPQRMKQIMDSKAS
jgi:hypothetical protein